MSSRCAQLLATLLLTAPVIADTPIDKPTLAALKRAIIDEIYANDAARAYEYVGKWLKPDGRRIDLYVEPTLVNDQGHVIYKLMPTGEVYRSFYLLKNGSVLLDGDFDGGFPPTHSSSFLTLYMDDARVVELKRAWRHESFDVEQHPSADVVREATKRNDAHSAR